MSIPKKSSELADYQLTGNCWSFHDFHDFHWLNCELLLLLPLQTNYEQTEQNKLNSLIHAWLCCLFKFAQGHFLVLNIVIYIQSGTSILYEYLHVPCICSAALRFYFQWKLHKWEKLLLLKYYVCAIYWNVYLIKENCSFLRNCKFYKNMK